MSHREEAITTQEALKIQSSNIAQSSINQTSKDFKFFFLIGKIMHIRLMCLVKSLISRGSYYDVLDNALRCQTLKLIFKKTT